MLKKYARMDCNESFLEVHTCSVVGCGGIENDPLGEDVCLDPLSDISNIGKTVLKALAKSRDISISERDRKALDEGRVTHEWISEKYPGIEVFRMPDCAKRMKEWQQRVMKAYKFKTQKALFQNMQKVDIEDDKEVIAFSSIYHLAVNNWGDPDGKTPSIEFKIPSDSSPEIIGAAIRYAIGNCRGMGADFIRSLIFPDGQLATFEDYLKELGLQ